MNNCTIVCKRTLTKANEVLETVSLSLFPSVHHSSVFAINKQPSTIHSLLRHLFFSHSSLACQAVVPRLRDEGWSLPIGRVAQLYAVTRHCFARAPSGAGSRQPVC